jgi:hypothetical protein
LHAGDFIDNCALTLDWDYSDEVEILDMSTAQERTGAWSYDSKFLPYDERWNRLDDAGAAPPYLPPGGCYYEDEQEEYDEDEEEDEDEEYEG